MWTSSDKARLPWTWGDTDALGPPDFLRPAGEPDARLAIRALETTADPETLFLWLCQLRLAPYSYDWIDNFGRRSPRQPDESLVKLEVGQRVMTIFTLTDFVPQVSLTLRMTSGWPTRVFGAISLRYSIQRIGAGRSVLCVHMWMPSLGGPLGRWGRALLAWGDLAMMRKQLRTLRELAQGMAPGAVPAEGNGGHGDGPRR